MSCDSSVNWCFSISLTFVFEFLQIANVTKWANPTRAMWCWRGACSPTAPSTRATKATGWSASNSVSVKPMDRGRPPNRPVTKMVTFISAFIKRIRPVLIHLDFRPAERFWSRSVDVVYHASKMYTIFFFFSFCIFAGEMCPFPFVFTRFS